ncbi:MAG TPA: extracellular solute-binding protein [Pseudonocardiaceae bacterium]|jgi:multiple sugar transport system substrate-binding protein|nr:extracellular solute-binding protein [Pseudonocardiaceae bacterium]
MPHPFAGRNVASMPGGIPPLTRRTLLKGLAGAAGLAAAVPVLAACGGGSASSATDTKQVTFGSNGSDPVPKKAYAATLAAFAKSSGDQVKVNTVDHDTFQNTISQYLQGTPDDVFTWFAGYRMQFFAAKGLAHPIDDVWQKIGGNFDEATKALSKGTDGHYYFVPIYNYPWGVFYRKSLFQAKGYEVPANWDDFMALAAKMKTDGLVPFSFGYGQGDSWTPLGTFDYLNMRINGYQFHMDLMHGKESWTDPKVNDVFGHYSQLVPLQQQGAAGRKWEDAAQALIAKQTGMFTLGLFVAQQFTNPSDLADLDFFAFPEINPTYGQESVEAPTDGFMVSAKPKNLAGAVKLMEFLGSAQAEDTYLAIDSANVAVNSQADTSKYNALQKKAVQFISQAKSLSQFGDRDSDPGFISNVVEPAIAKWLDNPGSTKSTLSTIESQKSQYFTQ